MHEEGTCSKPRQDLRMKTLQYSSAMKNNHRSLGGVGGLCGDGSLTVNCVCLRVELVSATIRNLTVSFYVNQSRLINRKYS